MTDRLDWKGRLVTDIELDGEWTTLYVKLIREWRKRARLEAWQERLEILTRPPRPGWQNEAACAGLGHELMFPPPLRGGADNATHVCTTWCPVRVECLADAQQWERLEHPSFMFAVRGGLTAQQRAVAYRRARAS